MRSLGLVVHVALPLACWRCTCLLVLCGGRSTVFLGHTCVWGCSIQIGQFVMQHVPTWLMFVVTVALATGGPRPLNGPLLCLPLHHGKLSRHTCRLVSICWWPRLLWSWVFDGVLASKTTGSIQSCSAAGRSGCAALNKIPRHVLAASLFAANC